MRIFLLIYGGGYHENYRFFSFSAFDSVHAFHVWPKRILHSAWPRVAERMNTPMLFLVYWLLLCSELPKTLCVGKILVFHIRNAKQVTWAPSGGFR